LQKACRDDAGAYAAFISWVTCVTRIPTAADRDSSIMSVVLIIALVVVGVGVFGALLVALAESLVADAPDYKSESNSTYETPWQF
jgi:hypothetical protein